ncbi:MAG TPA: lysophospholipid acyltransferase family protein [Egicoccus sp.]|nr:lysophospholipid acyltransferase family protein [Egicoccus sp.]HSK22255.1 lysophospholipid acyltransferase family protein [Egicoccus sp.]
MNNPTYTIVIGAVLTVFRVFNWKVKVTGWEHIPATGGGVVAANHIGYLDFVFVGYGALNQDKRRLRFMAKREVFDHKISGPLMRAMGHIAVDRAGNTRAALREAAEALQAGDLVGMFPEGTVSRSFVPLAGRPGAVRMAMDAGVPLIPAAVWGTQRIFTKGRKPTPTRGVVVTVQYGSPIDYTADSDPLEVHERLMASIREMVDQQQRSYPQSPRGPEDTWWQPAHLGGTAPTVEEAEAAAKADSARRREQRREQHRGS